jgi:hypothetical protein
MARKGSYFLSIAIVVIAVIFYLGYAFILNRANTDPVPAPAAPEAPPQATPEAPPQGAVGPLRYDVEWPAIPYAHDTLSDPVAVLAGRLGNDETRLSATESRGYLESLLQTLGIDPASQVLVFSKTSLQVEQITAATPRAIYFNDDTYVAWAPGAPNLEIASIDPTVGQVFYTLAQPPRNGVAIERQLARCLRCHDSYSLTGGGVPRFITGSGYVGPDGQLVSHEGWILTDSRTPLRFRWGGWYVTGRHGDQRHLGNMVVRDIQRLEADIDSLRIGNLDSLDGLVDTSPYLADTSDIVALLVLEHQVHVQNLITRASYESRTALMDASLDAEESGLGSLSPTLRDSIATIAEPLVDALLLADEVVLTDRIEGDPRFVQQFASRARRDSQGRSLRDLDLETRLFRYPLSFLVHSRAFRGLPVAVREQAAARIREVLEGRDTSERFSAVSDRDRRAIREILSETSSGALRF